MTVHVHGYSIVAFDGQHRVDKVKVGEGLTQDAVTTLQQQVSHHLQQGKAAKVAIILYASYVSSSTCCMC